jgi:hypothetical protein
LANNNIHAARGEGDLSSLQSSEAGSGRTGELAAEACAPAEVAASWDPYQVWLTRVKQPREQSERRQSRPVAVESAKTTDLSETARLRALSSALPR